MEGRRRHGAGGADLDLAGGAALSGVDVSVEIDFHPADLPAADFAQAKLEWADLIAKRDALLAEPPELVRQLSSIVDDPSFGWYMSVHAPHYSGRIDGLQVCTVARDGASGTLRIGAARGNEGRLVREQFREASDGRDEVPFGPDDLLEPAGIINDLVDRRRHGALAGLKREHRLEAQVLRGAIAVHAPSGEPLPPVTAVGQFPALYSPNGGARYTDVLLRQDSIPWVVELKEMVAGQGKYLRHAIAQAVLYRHFIRTAAHLHACQIKPPQWGQLRPPFPRPRRCGGAPADVQPVSSIS